MTTMTQNDTQCKLTHNALQCHHLKKLNLLKAPSLALQSLDDFKLQRFSKLDCALSNLKKTSSQDPSNPLTLPRPFKPCDSSNPCPNLWTLQRLFKPLHSNPPVFSAAASSAESACASWMASKALKANPQKANFESSSTCNVVC